MIRIASFSLVWLLSMVSIFSGVVQSQQHDRRGNPTLSQPHYQYYIVDSDDSGALVPTYNFVDTTYGTWQRLTNWPNNDNSCDSVPTGYDSIGYLYFSYIIEILSRSVYVGFDSLTNTPIYSPGAWVSTNGTICPLGADSSPLNVAMPSTLIGKDLVAPLWADWELRTAGDSTKIFVRCANDSFYVSFYNLGLKGTNGRVRATFQAAFSTTDSSITFNYRSFDGSWQGVPATELIQQVSTIGLTDWSGDAAMYLHKGYYFANSPTPKYDLSLHNGLSIRFLRMVNDAFLVPNVTMPPNDRYELGTTQFTPQCEILNISDSQIRIFVNTVITDLSDNRPFYNAYDSLDVTQGNPVYFNAPTAVGIGCGTYKVTFTISYRGKVSDEWAGNNTYTRYFVNLTPQTAPFREEFDEGLSPCLWSNVGAAVMDANTAFHVADAPIATGFGPQALVMNRKDANGYSYPSEVGGDTIVSPPIDLSATSDVYLWFHYQRGLVSDSSQAGIFARVHSGPELAVPGALGGLAQVGDSLVIEGLMSSGPEWNPAATDWATLGVISGGLDATLQTFRVQLGSQFLHNHFRVRFRVKARNAESPALYFEDDDNFVIDAIHVEPWRTEHTDLEPVDVDLGNGTYTQIPRNLASPMIPTVHILNNGDYVPNGVCELHLAILDALDRLVYDQTQLVGFPSARSEAVYSMPGWNPAGSQGPSFKAYVTLFNNVYETYPPNDTNIFYKTITINNEYGVDDGVPDTVNGTAQPASNFFFDFKSVMYSGSDTLRGISFFYPGSGSATNWTVTIVGNGDSVTRTFSITPTGRGWFTASITPFVMPATASYTMHFVLSSGTSPSGDASNGLVYYTYVDSTTPSNNEYGYLHPDVLGLFQNGSRVPFSSPTASIADAGGYLLPMFRLVTSGSPNELPVTLISLTADRAQNGSGILHWDMAAQDGLHGFEIQRAETGVSVGAVIAQSDLEHASYGFVDPAAPFTSTTYRLIGQMQNGSESTLGEVQLGPWSVDNASLSISVFPNPASGQVTVSAGRIAGDAPIMESLEIIDPLGRTILRTFPNAQTATIGLPNVQPGSYWIVARTANGIARARLAILH